MAKVLSSLDVAATGLRTRVLVIGAGPLGITTSIGLSRRGIPHLLVDSGGSVPGDAQELCDGEVTGGRYPDLVETRVRALGGTTHVWGGHSHPLRPIDFQPRPWLGLKGWPISHDEFRPWFGEVAPLFLIKDEWSADSVRNAPARITDINVPFFSMEAYRLTPRSGANIPPPGDFWSVNGHAVKGDVITGLTARALDLDGDGRVTGVRFSLSDGRSLAISADHVVLAMGGIETARFLLINQARGPSGPLSALPLIGKGFMEHPHPHMADVFLFRPLPGPFRRKNEDDGSSSRLVFFATPEIQEQRKLTSFYFRLDPYRGSAGWFGDDLRKVQMVGLFEQLPDDRRHVTLSRTKTDALGDPLTVLNYFATHEDHEAVNDAVDLAARALAIAGYGRTRLRMRRTSAQEPVAELPWIGVGHHHMGTVRMGRSPADGVVDANLRVFGTPNLYLATTGVFPTSSCVNPTMNGAAFAMRLAEHLARLES